MGGTGRWGLIINAIAHPPRLGEGARGQEGGRRGVEGGGGGGGGVATSERWVRGVFWRVLNVLRLDSLGEYEGISEPQCINVLTYLPLFSVERMPYEAPNKNRIAFSYTYLAELLEEAIQ